MMRVRRSSRIIRAALVAVIVVCLLAGCQMGAQEEEKSKQPPDFSNAGYIAELATLECYSHNVVRMKDDGAPPFNQGARKLWIEYSGVVRVGIDASQVVIEDPDARGVVVVRLPEAQILGLADVDEDTLDEVARWEAPFTDEYPAARKQEELAKAQEAMVDSLSSDDQLLAMARSRAKALLEEYIVNAGEAIGEEYTVEFVDIEPEEAETEK